MREAQRQWQRKHLLENLEEIHHRLNQIKGMAASGELPPRLQKKVAETVRVINGTTRSLQNWAITKGEKAPKVANKAAKKRKIEGREDAIRR
jgi:hypothetical protein